MRCVNAFFLSCNLQPALACALLCLIYALVGVQVACVRDMAPFVTCPVLVMLSHPGSLPEGLPVSTVNAVRKRRTLMRHG